MKTRILLIFVLFFFCAPATWASRAVESFQASLEKMYTDDDRMILFTAVVDPSQKNLPDHLLLLQADETGKKVKYRWKMQDNGFLGDKKGGDGIYSRKVEFKESKAGILFFTVALSSELEKTDTIQYPIPENLKVAVKIIQRPSFLELLGKVWHRLKNGSGDHHVGADLKPASTQD